MRIGDYAENTIGQYLGRITAIRRLTVYVIGGSSFTAGSIRPAKRKRAARRKPRERSG